MPPPARVPPANQVGWGHKHKHRCAPEQTTCNTWAIGLSLNNLGQDDSNPEALALCNALARVVATQTAIWTAAIDLGRKRVDLLL